MYTVSEMIIGDVYDTPNIILVDFNNGVHIQSLNKVLIPQ